MMGLMSRLVVMVLTASDLVGVVLQPVGLVEPRMGEMVERCFQMVSSMMEEGLVVSCLSEAPALALEVLIRLKISTKSKNVNCSAVGQRLGLLVQSLVEGAVHPREL